MRSLYKNWFVHNVFAHPLMWLLSFIGLVDLSVWVHDVTVPPPDLQASPLGPIQLEEKTHSHSHSHTDHLPSPSTLSQLFDENPQPPPTTDAYPTTTVEALMNAEVIRIIHPFFPTYHADTIQTVLWKQMDEILEKSKDHPLDLFFSTNSFCFIPFLSPSLPELQRQHPTLQFQHCLPLFIVAHPTYSLSISLSHSIIIDPEDPTANTLSIFSTCKVPPHHLPRLFHELRALYRSQGMNCFSVPLPDDNTQEGTAILLAFDHQTPIAEVVRTFAHYSSLIHTAYGPRNHPNNHLSA